MSKDIKIIIPPEERTLIFSLLFEELQTPNSKLGTGGKKF